MTTLGPPRATRQFPRFRRAVPACVRAPRDGRLIPLPRPRQRLSPGAVTLSGYVYRNPGGGVRFFVACSNPYASCRSFGSLHAGPVKPTP